MQPTTVTRKTATHAVYVSHTGMSEPLGRSQVVPYLIGLARAGWSIDVVAFEPADANTDDIHAVTELLADYHIGYLWTRRSPSHAFGVKLLESMRAFMSLLAAAMRRRPRILHARSYLPAAAAQGLATIAPGIRFLFDCRGLLGDEYVDFGHWQRDSWRYRLIKAAEKQLFGRADGIVTLTDRLRRWLCDDAHLVDPRTPIEVIPCCVDLARFRFDASGRRDVRKELGAGDRFVLAYSGTLGSFYCEEKMAQLFAAIRRRRRSLFTIFTRADSRQLRAHLARLGVPDEDVQIRRAAPSDMARLLSGADAAVGFIEPRFSKIASSPVKIPEYLAVGLPIVINRGVGDQDELMASDPDAVIDAGAMDTETLERAAERLVTRDLHDDLRQRARRIAAERFSLELGVKRYLRIYERLANA